MIKEAMAATIEESKANDPKALKAQVASLSQQLHKAVEKLAAERTAKATPKPTGMTMAECMTMIDSGRSRRPPSSATSSGA